MCGMTPKKAEEMFASELREGEHLEQYALGMAGMGHVLIGIVLMLVGCAAVGIWAVDECALSKRINVGGAMHSACCLIAFYAVWKLVGYYMLGLTNQRLIIFRGDAFGSFKKVRDYPRSAKVTSRPVVLGRRIKIEDDRHPFCAKFRRTFMTGNGERTKSLLVTLGV